MIKIPINYQQNEWVHIGITFDQSKDQISFFQNGELLSNHTANFDFSNFIDSDVLVCESNSQTLIDDFEIYDESLSNMNDIYNSFSLSNVVKLNEWSHIVVNHDKSQKESEIYINGSNVGKFINYEGTINNNSEPIVIGENVVGEIADVIIFERPMFNNEINSLSSKVYQNMKSKTLFEFSYQDMNTIHISDDSDQANHGICESVIRYYPGHKIGSKALGFDGNQTINVNIGDEYDLNQMTLSAYIKTLIGSESSIMQKDGSFEWKITSEGYIQFNNVISSLTQINNNIFTHIGINLDTFESKLNLYKNGVLTETLTLNEEINSTTSIIKIGVGFIGELDITRMDVGYINKYYDYNSVLSPFDLNKTYDTVQLLGKYAFNESGGVSVIDKSIFQNHGVLINEPTRKLGTFVVQSKGLEFDASKDQYVRVSGSTYKEVDMNLLTLGVWMKLTNTGEPNGIIQKENAFELNVDVNGYIKFNQNGESVMTSTLTVEYEVWTHITTLLDNFNNNIIIYKNGIDKEILQPVTKLNIPTSESNIYIGSNLTGELDNIDIYQGLLSEEQILSLASTDNATYSPSNIVSDEWTHVAAVYDKNLNKICIYHNGEYNGCYRNYLNSFSQIGVNSNNIYIATTGDSYTFYDGILDDIRVYNKTMNQSEIKELVNMYDNQVLYMVGTLSATFTNNEISVDVINIREPANMVQDKTITYYGFATVNNRLRGKNDVLSFVNGISTINENNVYESITITSTGNETETLSTWTPNNLLNVITTGYNYIPLSKVNQAYVYIVGVSYDQQVHYLKNRIISSVGTQITLEAINLKPIENVLQIELMLLNNTYEITSIYVAAFDYDISTLSVEDKILLMQNNADKIYVENELSIPKEQLILKQVELGSSLSTDGTQIEIQNISYNVCVLCIDTANNLKLESYQSEVFNVSSPLIEYRNQIILPNALNFNTNIDIDSSVIYYNEVIGKYYIAAFELTPSTSIERIYDVNVFNSKYYINGEVSPIIKAYVGDKLIFNMTTIGHPLHIKSELVSSSIPGVINDLSGSEITNNGSQSGIIEWTPIESGVYYYQCENHLSMSGMIEIYGNHNERNHIINVDTSQTNTYYMTGDVLGEYPTINVYMNDKLTFNLYVMNHPFNIKTSLVDSGIPGTLNNLEDVSNNGIEVGTIEWSPTTPGVYYYQCGNHASMYGVINVLAHKYPKTTNMNITNISRFIETITLETSLVEGINAINEKANSIYMSINNPNSVNTLLNIPAVSLSAAFVSFDDTKVRDIEYTKKYCVAILTKNPIGFKVYFNDNDMYN